MDIDEVRNAYDTVATQYRARFADELAHKPFDRAWLDDFAGRLPRGAQVLKMGCGDGHVSAYLAAGSVAISGLDLSPAMVAVARRAYPTLAFATGNMLALDCDVGSADAVVAFYSIVNLQPHDCQTAFMEIRRALRDGGLLTLAFHIGDETLRVQNWWDTGANLDFFLHPPERVCHQLIAAKFEIIQSETRALNAADVEAQTVRAYVLARAQPRELAEAV